MECGTLGHVITPKVACPIAFALLLAGAVAADERVQIEPRTGLGSTKRRSTATISATANLVMVPVSVLDAAGAPVRGLSRGGFRLFEDGVEQTVQSFGEEDAPVSIGIVFDASRSMRPRLAAAKEAAERLFEQARPGDEYHLVEFNDAPRVLCDLTGNTAAVSAALGRVAVRGFTALFDGIILSAQSMRRAKNARRALVILSDGEDNFSRYEEGEVKSYLDEAGVVIYSIGISNGPFAGYQARHLRRFAEQTGGHCYPGVRSANLGDAVRSIGDAIRSQYLLSYYSANRNAEGKYRRIHVRTPAGDRRDWSASWRAGYHGSDVR